MVLSNTVPDILINETLGVNGRQGCLNSLTAVSVTVALFNELLRNLGAHVGSNVTIINPQGRATPFGTVPREISYRVSAIFEIGVYDFDKAYIVMPMEDAQLLLLTGDQVQMIEIGRAHV